MDTRKELERKKTRQDNRAVVVAETKRRLVTLGRQREWRERCLPQWLFLYFAARKEKRNI